MVQALNGNAMGMFQTTNWSLVVAGASGDSPGAREALARLCEAYWNPLYAYVRRRGYDPDDARDLVQSYFAHLLEKGALRGVTPGAGRFRSYLLTCLSNFLSHERQRASSLKRGGGRAPLSLDTDVAESRYSRSWIEETTPEREFERSWALTVLERALGRVEEDLKRAGQSRRYERFKPLLTEDAPGTAYKGLAEELGMSTSAVKVAVHRMRRRFGDALRDEIAQTVADEGQIESEIRHLLSIVR